MEKLPWTSKSNSNHCSAINCTNNRKNRRDLSIFRFPKDSTRSRKWVQNSRRADLLSKDVHYLYVNCSICSDHFEISQFMNKNKDKLVWNAVPTLFDIPNPPPSILSKRSSPKFRQFKSPKPKKSISTLVPQISEVETTLPSQLPCTFNAEDEHDKKLKRQNRALKMQLYRLKKKSDSIKCLSKCKSKNITTMKMRQLETLLKDFLKKPEVNFIMSQVEASLYKPKGYRWSSRDKALALTLLHSSPKTYRILKKRFSLPSERTLHRVMENIQLYPGFSSVILNALELKIKRFPELAKLVCITLDEMAIKQGLSYDGSRDVVEGLCEERFVNHALVFVVRSIVHRWKQPFGYFHSCGPMTGALMHELLLEAISKLQNISLQVKVVICDQGSNNMNLFLKRLNAQVDKPYFMYNSKKVFLMFDPPHLIKNIRNNLKKSGFLVNGADVDWQHIRSFFEKDSEKPIRMAPKLTQKHVNLPPFRQLSVKLATQVLSHSVAAGMSFMVQWDIISEDASETASFLEAFDQLFNCFNSSTVNSTASMRHAFSRNSGHREFLLKKLAWLDTVKSKGNRQLHCIKGWKLNINSLLQLWDNLQQYPGLKFLFTRRLNQDVVENLFSVIRLKGGARDNPNASEFRTALRQVMVDAVMAPGKMSNCEEDIDEFLFTLRSPESPVKVVFPDPLPIKHLISGLPESVSTVITAASYITCKESNILVYIGGYIVRRVRDKLCSTCRETIASTVSEQNPMHDFLRSKLCPGAEGLLAPSFCLHTILKACEIAYRQVIERALHQVNVKHSLMTTLLSDVDWTSLSCAQCQIKQVVLQLFINIRLHHTLRMINQNITDPKWKRNRKYLKFCNL